MRSALIALVTIALFASEAAAQQVIVNRAPVQGAATKPLFEACISVSVGDPQRLQQQPGLYVQLVSGNVQQQDQSATLTGTVSFQQAMCYAMTATTKLAPIYTLRDATVTLQRTVTSSTTIAAPGATGSASASTSGSAGVKVAGQQVSSTTVKAGVASSLPTITNERAYVAIKGRGNLEWSANNAGTLLVIQDFAFEATDADGGKVMVQSGTFKLNGCAMRLTPGLAIDRDGISVAGKLTCGSYEFANAKLKNKPLQSTTGSGELKLYGLPFNVTFAMTNDDLKGTARWAGQSRDFVRLPSLPGLELRVTGPVATLSFVQKRTGPNNVATELTTTFDAERVELRTQAKMPNGEPWLSAYVDPGPSTMSANGTTLALPALAAVINDPFKAARDTCLAAANAVANNPTTQTDERADAINACNTIHPKPPAVPSAPRSISLDVTLVVR